MIPLRGMTWDHPRGYAPLEACSRIGEVEIVWDRRSLREFGDTPLSDLAEGYDLLIVDHPHMGQAAAGLLRPLEDWMDVESFARRNDTVSLRSYQWRGRTWALPVDAACQVSARRPDLVSEAPADWEEVFELDRRLRPNGVRVGMALCPTDCLCGFLTLSAQAGCPPRERSWMPDAAVSGVLERLRRIRDHVHPDSLDWNPIRLYETMTSGDEVAYSPLAFGYTDYARPGRATRLRFGGIPGGTGALLGGAGIGVSSRSAHPEAAAVAAAAHLAGRAYQTDGYTRNGGQPAHAAAWESPQCDAWTGGFLSGTRRTLESAFTRPREPEWPAFQERLGERIHAFLKADGGVEDCVQDLRELHKRFFGA